MDVPAFCACIRDLGFTRVFSGSTDPDRVLRQAEHVHAAGLRAAPTVPLIPEMKRKALPYEGMSDEAYLTRAAEAVKRLRRMIEAE